MAKGYEQQKWVAQTLGLSIDPPDDSFWNGVIVLDGSLDGVRVQVEQWQGQFVHIFFRAFFEAPADLGMSITTEGFLSKIGHLLGKHDVEVGDQAFDKVFRLKALEPERLRALLQPGLRSYLLTWSTTPMGFRIQDDAVRGSLMLPVNFSSYPGGEELASHLRSVVALARLFQAAIFDLPPSSRLAPVSEAWRVFSEESGLSFSPSPLRCWGTLGGASFVARAVALDEEGHGVEVKVRFAKALPWQLRIRPPRLLDFLEKTGESVKTETGDDTFDERLRTLTSDTARTTRLLSPTLRSLLLELHEDEGDVCLDSQGLTVQTRSMTDPNDFTRIIHRAALVAAQIQPDR